MMKAIVITSTLLIVFLFIRATIFKDKTINKGIEEDKGIEFFEGSFQEALDVAKKENKLIFLDAYASWCGPCKMMNWKVFSSSKAGDFFNGKFINLKIDMEKGEGPVLAKKYNVTAYPSLFIIDFNGKIVIQTVGYHNSNQLIEFAELSLK